MTTRHRVALFSRAFACAFVACLLVTNIASADIQQRIIEDLPFYEPTDVCGSTGSATTPSTTNPGGKNIYVIGDSITVGMNTGNVLQTKLSNTGWNVTQIEATSGIHIAESIPKITADASKVQSADVVVVELGTNDFASSQAAVEADIQKMVTAIKTVNTNPQLQIDWMNTYSTKLNMANVNAAIDAEKSLFSSVIDWNQEAGSNVGNKYTFDSSIGVHQTSGQGYANMSDFVVSQLNSASTTSSNSSTASNAAGCCNATQAGANATNSAPTPNVAAFVDKYGQMAYDNSLSTGVPYEFTLGQAIIESGFGASELSAKYNNFFGIKAAGGWTGPTVTLPTQEVVNGTTITIQAQFRVYATAQGSFADHDQFFHQNPRYAAAFQYSNDPIQFLTVIANAGYATDPSYISTVGAVINQVTAYVASKHLWPPSSQVTYNITTPPSNGGGTATTTAASGSCSCSSNATLTTLDTTVVPQPYAQIFSAAGAKYAVAPAFLAAIFYGGEHGNSWPIPPPPYGSGPAWASSSAGAQGPMQFIPGTWSKYGVDGNGDGKVDVEDLTDAAFGAANYFANGFHVANTTDEQKLRKAAADYNGIGNPNSSYSNNVWAAYLKFSGGSPGSGTASASSSCPSGSGGVDGYQNPYRDIKNLTAMRIDEGVDYGGDGPIYALGPGTVVYARSNTGWPGGTFIIYQLSAGAAKDKYVYVAENCTVLVKVPQSVDATTPLCTLHSTWPFSESGWADGSNVDLAAAFNVYSPDGTATAFGWNFNQLLVKLGAPSGTFQFPNQKGGNNLTGTLPAGWPTW